MPTVVGVPESVTLVPVIFSLRKIPGGNEPMPTLTLIGGLRLLKPTVAEY